MVEFATRTGAFDDEDRRVFLRDGFLAPLEDVEGLRFFGKEAVGARLGDGGGEATVGGGEGRRAVVVCLRGEDAEGR